MPKEVSSKTPRWKWAVMCLLVISALSVPTAIVYLQHRLQARPNDTARPWNDPTIAQKLADGRLAKAKAIREEWRTWALKHKDGLRVMLSSQGKDFSALQAVYKVSPPLTLKDWRPDTRSGPAKFGWHSDLSKIQANGIAIKWADAKSKAAYESRQVETLPWLKKSFADKSDFIVADSVNVGPTTTQIWASGRVTERTWVANPDRSKGKPASIELPYKELVPPFDFLTSASSG